MANQSINHVFAVVFAILAMCMAALGIVVLASWPSNNTEWTIVALSFFSAFFLFYGAKQTVNNAKRQADAEAKENQRLQNWQSKKAPKIVDDFEVQKNAKEIFQKEAEIGAPKILAHWQFDKNEWHFVLKKVINKTYREEIYTAVWFPVMFGIILWNQFWWGFFGGVLLGGLYMLFRGFYVSNKFKISPHQQLAEIIISDAYLRINGNYIHYADGKYFVKNILRERDKKAGDLLHFDIGWYTSKGIAASMDLYIPIPQGRQHEAENILSVYKS